MLGDMISRYNMVKFSGTAASYTSDKPLDCVSYDCLPLAVSGKSYTAFRLFKVYPSGTAWDAGVYSMLDNAESEVMYLEKHEKDSEDIRYVIKEEIYSYLLSGNTSDKPGNSMKEVEVKYPAAYDFPLVNRACPPLI